MRQSRNLTEIAAQTCISRRYLEAIEADNVADLPGDFFYKAFLRQYANALDLDGATTQKILSAAVPISEPDPLPALNQVYERAQVGESTRWRPPMGVAIGLLLVVLAAGSGLYAWWSRVQSTQEVVEQAPTPAATAPPAVAPAPQTPAPEQAQPAQQPPATDPQQQAQQPAAAPQAVPTADPVPPPAVGEFPLQLAANEPAWVQVTSEGKTLFIGTLTPEQPRQFNIGPTGRIRTGNAGALDIRYAGKPLGAIGPKGQIRTVVLNGDAAQVVAPVPKPQPAAPPAQ